MHAIGAKTILNFGQRNQPTKIKTTNTNAVVIITTNYICFMLKKFSEDRKTI